MNLLHNHLHNHRLAEDCHAFHAGALVYSILEATQTKLISFELSVYISGIFISILQAVDISKILHSKGDFFFRLYRYLYVHFFKTIFRSISLTSLH